MQTKIQNTVKKMKEAVANGFQMGAVEKVFAAAHAPEMLSKKDLVAFKEFRKAWFKDMFNELMEVK